jgi:hypothetical protein
MNRNVSHSHPVLTKWPGVHIDSSNRFNGLSRRRWTQKGKPLKRFAESQMAFGLVWFDNS